MPGNELDSDSTINETSSSNGSEQPTSEPQKGLESDLMLSKDESSEKFHQIIKVMEEEEKSRNGLLRSFIDPIKDDKNLTDEEKESLSFGKIFKDGKEDDENASRFIHRTGLFDEESELNKSLRAKGYGNKIEALKGAFDEIDKHQSSRIRNLIGDHPLKSAQDGLSGKYQPLKDSEQEIDFKRIKEGGKNIFLLKGEDLKDAAVSLVFQSESGRNMSGDKKAYINITNEDGKTQVTYPPDLKFETTGDPDTTLCYIERGGTKYYAKISKESLDAMLKVEREQDRGRSLKKGGEAEDLVKNQARSEEDWKKSRGWIVDTAVDSAVVDPTHKKSGNKVDSQILSDDHVHLEEKSKKQPNSPTNQQNSQGESRKSNDVVSYLRSTSEVDNEKARDSKSPPATPNGTAKGKGAQGKDVLVVQ